MRLDKYLKISRLIKRRTVANEACDAGRVLVNDRPAKASAQVKAGDTIEIQFGSKNVKMAIFTSGKDKLSTFRRRERPKNSLENCSARFLPDRPTVKSYPLDQSAKRPRMRYLSPRHVQELDRLLFCVGSASKAVLQMTCSLAWTRARLRR